MKWGQDFRRAVLVGETGRTATRSKPVRGPLPAHLPRERIVIPGPTVCPCCQGRLAKLGETITETLEVIPRQWKVIQTVREKFTCRACETITQPPAPFHPIARGRAGPELLAMILEAKFGQHLPLNRQSETYAREDIHLDVSTMADWVGACTAALAPLVALIRAHVLGAARIHGDDTTVPVLARGKTITGRLWTYVRDDRPFGGPAPPAALFHYSRDRGGEHPRQHLANYAGILQADAYAGFERLYASDREPGQITPVACWAHARRKLHDVFKADEHSVARQGLDMIRDLYAIERQIDGAPAEQRRQARAVSKAKALEFFAWADEVLSKVSARSPLAEALRYAVKLKPQLLTYTQDGRLEIDNNPAENALRGICLGRKNWLFAGADCGGERAAAMYSLLETAKLNSVNPQEWLANVLDRIGKGHPINRIDELLPWIWEQAI